MAMNYGFAFRLSTYAILTRAARGARSARARAGWSSTRRTTRSTRRRSTGSPRSSTATTPPARSRRRGCSDHPIFGRIGQPLLLPGTNRTSSYLCVAGEGAESSLYSASHGAGSNVKDFAERGLSERGSAGQDDAAVPVLRERHRPRSSSSTTAASTRRSSILAGTTSCVPSPGCGRSRSSIERIGRDRGASAGATTGVSSAPTARCGWSSRARVRAAASLSATVRDLPAGTPVVLSASAPGATRRCRTFASAAGHRAGARIPRLPVRGGPRLPRRGRPGRRSACSSGASSSRRRGPPFARTVEPALGLVRALRPWRLVRAARAWPRRRREAVVSTATVTTPRSPRGPSSTRHDGRPSLWEFVAGSRACDRSSSGTSKDPNAKVTILLVSPETRRPVLAVKVPTTDAAARRGRGRGARAAGAATRPRPRMSATIPRVVDSGRVPRARAARDDRAAGNADDARSYLRRAPHRQPGRVAAATSARPEPGSPSSSARPPRRAAPDGHGRGRGDATARPGSPTTTRPRRRPPSGSPRSTRVFARNAVPAHRRPRRSVVRQRPGDGNGRVSGVVDWEAGATVGEPVRDLVRFAIMYALVPRPPHAARAAAWRPSRTCAPDVWGAGIDYALDGRGWFPDLFRRFVAGRAGPSRSVRGRAGATRRSRASPRSRRSPTTLSSLDKPSPSTRGLYVPMQLGTSDLLIRKESRTSENLAAPSR